MAAAAPPAPTRELSVLQLPFDFTARAYRAATIADGIVTPITLIANGIMTKASSGGPIPNSMIGERVRYGALGDVKGRGGSPVEGEIVDEVWELEKGGAPEARKLPDELHWGEYCFFSQLIAWSNGYHSIRIGYYRRRCGEPNWTFGSQTTVSADPPTIARLLKGTLAQTNWFKRRPAAS